jgi:beta-phosphoglucomutase-like phosphatase (HAD superfamily)
VLGVDLDGVVADFYEGIRPFAAEWLGVPEDALTRTVSYGLPEWNLQQMGGSASEAYERLHRFAVTQRNLFQVLAPVHGAPAALRRLSALQTSTARVRIRIITHRLYIKYFHQEALTQTIGWLENHGIPYWDLCFMQEKAAVGAHLYIEDSPANVESLRASGHDTIVFDNSTNRHVAEPRARTWNEAEELVREAFQRAHEASSLRGVKNASPSRRNASANRRAKVA